MTHRHHNHSQLSKSYKHANFRLERWHRLMFYSGYSWLFATGLMWIAAHFILRSKGEFGEYVHPLEPWSMKLHGAGAMFILFFLGSLMNSHIRWALKAGRNRYSGWSMILLFLALIVSGYGLYYLTGENSRSIWSSVHWGLGLLLPILVIAHITLGKKSRT